MFHEADNADCSLVTIMAGRVADLDDVPGIIADLRTDLRNLRDRSARRSRRWKSVEAIGYIETDALLTEDVDKLPPQRRAMVEGLPVRSTGRMTWLPHLHAVVHHPGLDRPELRDALQRQWPGSQRVDVKAFWDDSDAGDNAGRAVAYSLKADMKTSYEVTLSAAGGREYRDAIVEAWPVSWRAIYWSWLCSMMDGLRPLRVRLGARRERTRDQVVVQKKSVIETEPMPMILA